MALRWSGYNLPPAQGIFHGKLQRRVLAEQIFVYLSDDEPQARSNGKKGWTLMINH